MLVFLVGELLVSVIYFLIFVNVNTGNCDVVSGIFGLGFIYIW